MDMHKRYPLATLILPLLISSHVHAVGFTEPLDSAKSNTIASDELGDTALQITANNEYKVPNPATAGNFVKIKLDWTRGASNPYTKPILIDHSNVILDCNYATIAGQGSLPYGIKIAGPADHEIKNITIKNCKVDNFSATDTVGIQIVNSYAYDVDIGNNMTQSQIDTMNASAVTRTGCNAGSPINRDLLRECVRNLSPENILITNVKLTNNFHGLNIGKYVKGAVITDSEISNNVVGTHISYSSSHTAIKRSMFAGNGYRPTGSKREAIVIDSSSWNLIQDSEFANNYGSAIRTYKNCWELKLNSNNQLRGNNREDPSDHNTIERNSFYLTNSFAPNDNAAAQPGFDNNNYFKAVSIADRQSTIADQWNCFGGYYYTDPNSGANFARDYSKQNIIENNQFRNYRMPIRILDDNNTVLNNTFLNSNGISVLPEIYIGSLYRSLVNQPVIGNIIKGNSVETGASGDTVKTVRHGAGTAIIFNDQPQP